MFVNKLTDEELALVLYTNFSGRTKQLVEFMEVSEIRAPTASSAFGTFWMMPSSRWSTNASQQPSVRVRMPCGSQVSQWPTGSARSRRSSWS